MKNLEISARTVEEAIQQALDQLGVTRKEVEVTVLSEGNPDVADEETEEATVRVELLESASEEENDIFEIAKDVLETLIAKMGITALVESHNGTFFREGDGGVAGPVAFDIKGDDLGILIGRRGQTLACLQHVVRIIIAHKIKSMVPVIVDVEGYKQRRYESLQALAGRMAEQVMLKQIPFAVEPMPAYERRIIHLALVDHPDVTTQSIGEDEARKVVILLRDK